MHEKKIIIIGGGLVGALQCCFMAEQGFDVSVYEKSEDLRTAQKVFGRSINLALSTRGREALRRMHLEDDVIKNGVRMYARMIHDLDGSTHAIPYGKDDQCIISVDRRRLNEILLSAAEKYSNVKIFFNHKLINCNFEKNEAVFQTLENEDTVTVKFDLLFGCDGAYSITRRLIMQRTRFTYSQEFIADRYIELRIPPDPFRQYAIEQHSLHIWPRETFMLIALPNVQDHSFVLTLFMPADGFEALSTDQLIVEFFQKNFSDALQLIGKDEVITAFKTLKPLSLVSIKCFPYHVGENVVLFGDAAHAMVPFYGQGLNCGFEDLIVFSDFMEKYNNDLGSVLPEYSKYRSIDVHCMNDLAMYNYKEMRSDVNTYWYIMRKKIDGVLHKFFPTSWIPLYTMVAFTRLRYHECVRHRDWQDTVLHRLMKVSAAGTLLVLAAFVAKFPSIYQY